ncbi:type II toxin-antitoxin system VapB family antitoxin [uncultured Algimonas sp.]|uniref:type II toxin-antitoxin system VapB family antitoxin n=1 Tax=uncultured Algimonas sp. TaxID=1547920 RepID=UPI0026313480|nr:type II toxin-antitoxin system VapB family antitoxin [uncultured Algimonas sp.]
MRTTVTLDQEKLETASSLSGISNRTELINAALDALIAHEAAMRLARLGGSEPDLEPAPRRRFS